MKKLSKAIIGLSLSLYIVACNFPVTNNNFNTTQKSIIKENGFINLKISNNPFKQGFNTKYINFSDTLIKKLKLEITGLGLTTVSETKDWTPNTSVSFKLTVPSGDNRVVNLVALDENNNPISQLMGLVNVLPNIDNIARLNYGETISAQVVYQILKSTSESVVNNFSSASLKSYINSLIGFDTVSNEFSKINPARFNSSKIAQEIITNNGVLPSNTVTETEKLGSIKVNLNVTGAKILVTDLNSSMNASTTTLSTQIDNITMGRWYLTIIKPNYKPQSVLIDVGNTLSDVNVNLETVNDVGSISGVIRASDGSPNISGATIKLFKNNQEVLTTTSDVNGNYTFSNIAIGTGYYIQVIANGYTDFWYYDITVTQNGVFTVDTLFLTVSSIGANVITGVIKDYNLVAVGASFIKIYNSAGLLISTGLVNADGTYNINVPIGTNYYFEVYRSGYTTFVYRNLNVVSGNTINIGEILLSLTNSTFGTVTGILKDADTQALLTGVPVRVYYTVNGIKYLVGYFLSGAGGVYNFNLPIGSGYSFETIYNGITYTYNNLVVVSGTNTITSIDLGGSGNTGDVSVIINPTQPSPSSTPTSSSIATPPINNNIIFLSSEGNIYTINENGNNLFKFPDINNATKFSDGSDSIFTPSWSPDNNKILYEATPSSQEIFIMNSDGTNKKQLTNLNRSFISSFSKDGTKIVFISGRDIYTMNADGSEQKKITNDSFSEFSPVFSPDGSKIAFTSNRDGNLEIYTINSDGTNLKRITSNTNPDYFPYWSPDGTKLLNMRFDKFYSLYSINLLTQVETKVSGTFQLPNQSTGRWSPDGTKISFIADSSQLFIADSDGSNTKQITFLNNKFIESYSWKPDGTKIVFISNTFPSSVGIVNSDGTNLNFIYTSEKSLILSNPSFSK